MDLQKILADRQTELDAAIRACSDAEQTHADAIRRFDADEVTADAVAKATKAIDMSSLHRDRAQRRRDHAASNVAEELKHAKLREFAGFAKVATLDYRAGVNALAARLQAVDVELRSIHADAFTLEQRQRDAASSAERLNAEFDLAQQVPSRSTETNLLIRIALGAHGEKTRVPLQLLDAVYERKAG